MHYVTTLMLGYGFGWFIYEAIQHRHHMPRFMINWITAVLYCASLFWLTFNS